MQVFLCGFSGSGKTWIIEHLRSSTQYESGLFLDLDELVAEAWNIEINRLGQEIVKMGWEKFRETESKLIEQILSREHFVCALGGGALNNSVLRQISQADLYWVKEDFDACYKRISNDPNRPLAIGKTKEELIELYNVRQKFYQKANLVGTSTEVLDIFRKVL